MIFGALRRVLPLLDDIARTHGQTLAQDALAGTLTAILLIPQALAYALLAGLPPQVGLYASVLPPVLYALFGGSRTLAVGPVSVASIMVATALHTFAGADQARYLAGALMLSAMTGGVLLLLAFCRLGWLTHFISHPVLSGFTTGAAIYIVGSQLSALTGVAVPREASFFQVLTHLAAQSGESSPITLIFSVASIGALVVARKPLTNLLQLLGVREPIAVITTRTAPLLLVVITTVITARMGLHESGLAVIGDIPRGLHGLDFAFLSQTGWDALAPSALMIALVGYIESISVARTLAFRRREKIDPDRELLALGLTNLGGACIGAMPVAGGFARSMVNFDAGARTQAAAIVTAGWVAIGALFFTGLLHDLPKAVLAAIIVVAVFQLIDFRSLRRTWRYERGDGLAQFATIIGVLTLGIEKGLIVGISLGVAVFIYKTSHPHIAIVGRVAGTEHFRNIHRYQVETWPELLLLRVDENLYFGNTPRIETQLMDLVVEHHTVRDVVLILSGVAHIDASSLEMLESFAQSLAEKNIRLHLAEVKGPVMDKLARTAFLASLGPTRIHLSANAAVLALSPAITPPRAPSVSPASA
jgi:sulfate permease, SulP family